MSFDLSKIEYIDIHSHLQFQSNEGDRSEVIKRMKENNIATICISTDTKESKLAKSLAEENENIFYSTALTAIYPLCPCTGSGISQCTGSVGQYVGCRILY